MRRPRPARLTNEGGCGTSRWVKRLERTHWFPFTATEVEFGLATFGCIVTVLTLAGVERHTIGVAAGGYAVLAYLAGLLVYARRAARSFVFLPGGALGGSGYIDLVRGAQKSLLLMHVDDDPPGEELLGVYRGLLERGVQHRRLICVRENARPGAYGWLEEFGGHDGLEQRVVLPEQAQVMRLSLVVVDERVVVLSLPGGAAIESRDYARGFVFRDLLLLEDEEVAAAFIEIHRQLWSESVPLERLTRLRKPLALINALRGRLPRGP